MLEFIIKYWVQVLLGTIVGALTFFCKKFYNLYIGEKKHQKTKEQEEFYKSIETLIKESIEESRREDSKLQAQINVMKNGILSIQGRDFKAQCREYLREDRDISIEDFELLQEEYDTYKSLGGNHDGDLLFNMVREKVTNIFTDK